MGWGGKRDGAGRKSLPDSEMRKTHSIVARDDEWAAIKDFTHAVKQGRAQMQKIAPFSEFWKAIIWGLAPFPATASPLAVVMLGGDDKELNNVHGILLKFASGNYALGAALTIQRCPAKLAKKILARLEEQEADE